MGITFMKSNLPVLEYSLAQASARKPGKWAFRFRTRDGNTLFESTMNFRSQAEAERKFISLIKSIATNEYKVVTKLNPVTTGRE